MMDFLLGLAIVVENMTWDIFLKAFLLSSVSIGLGILLAFKFPLER